MNPIYKTVCRGRCSSIASTIFRHQLPHTHPKEAKRMGSRYLKKEEEAVVEYYPTASRAEILEHIPDRTWSQIGVKARKMGIHRTSKTWGNSVREGRKLNLNAWTDEDNEKFDTLFPHATYAVLLAAFPTKTLVAMRSHAEKRHLYRTPESIARQMRIGQQNSRKGGDIE